eukprot:11270191-Karenia_brevis.AAC.1
MSLEDAKEFDLVTKCIDAQCAGKLAHSGDILMQRFKSMDMLQETGSYATAGHLEIHHAPSGLASPGGLRIATRNQADEEKMKAIQQRRP